jgi:uncharacterized protein (DUF433 family)
MIAIQSEAPPLRIDEAGAIRIADTRVLLEIVVNAFRAGSAPEEIARDYSTLELSDVYAVIAYCLRHQAEIDEYLAERERMATEVRARIDAWQGDLTEIRERLLSRKPD